MVINNYVNDNDENYNDNNNDNDNDSRSDDDNVDDLMAIEVVDAKWMVIYNYDNNNDEKG